MREIKFRAWNEVEEKIYNWYEFLNTNMKNTFITPESTAMILMQYTGLKDKNGTEIYEGDIVKIHAHSYDYGFSKNRIGQIKFLDGSFGFYKQLSEKEYLFNELSTEYGYGELDYYEVIGNIYKNPELLEDKE